MVGSDGQAGRMGAFRSLNQLDARSDFLLNSTVAYVAGNLMLEEN